MSLGLTTFTCLDTISSTVDGGTAKQSPFCSGFIIGLKGLSINYDLEIIGGNELNGGLYNLSGEWLSELKAGHAIVNESDIKDHPDFKIQVDDKTYTIKSK